MIIAALSKAPVLFDMTDMFQILSLATVSILESKLETIHDCQATSDHLEQELITNPHDTALLAEQATASASLTVCTQYLQNTSIITTNLIKSFKDVDEATIRRSNAYYAKYGASWSAENLV